MHTRSMNKVDIIFGKSKKKKNASFRTIDSCRVVTSILFIEFIRHQFLQNKYWLTNLLQWQLLHTQYQTSEPEWVAIRFFFHSQYFLFMLFSSHEFYTAVVCLYVCCVCVCVLSQWKHGAGTPFISLLTNESGEKKLSTMSK